MVGHVCVCAMDWRRNSCICYPVPNTQHMTTDEAETDQSCLLLAHLIYLSLFARGMELDLSPSLFHIHILSF